MPAAFLLLLQGLLLLLFFSLVSEIEKTGVVLGLKKTNENNKGQEWGIATASKKK